MMRELAGCQRRPAGVMIEMPRDERNVDVARLADRLAVVHRLEHREEALALLHVAGDRVEIARALLARQRGPGFEGAARRFHGAVDIGRASLRDAGEERIVGGIGDVKSAALRRRGEFAADKVLEAGLMALEPGADMVVRLGRRAVFHGVQDFDDFVHGSRLTFFT